MAPGGGTRRRHAGPGGWGAEGRPLPAGPARPISSMTHKKRKKGTLMGDEEQQAWPASTEGAVFPASLRSLQPPYIPDEAFILLPSSRVPASGRSPRQADTWHSQAQRSAGTRQCCAPSPPGPAVPPGAISCHQSERHAAAQHGARPWASSLAQLQAFGLASSCLQHQGVGVVGIDREPFSQPREPTEAV